jgi:hypothetical protein
MPSIPDRLSPADAYGRLVTAVRSGLRFRPATIRQILESAGKTYEALVLDALADSRPEGPEPGDLCECGGALVIRTSKRQGNCQVQWLACSECGRPAGKRVTAGQAIRRRRKRVVTKSDANS